MFKLNDEKTEVILSTSMHGLKPQPNIIVAVGERQQLQSCLLSVISRLSMINTWVWITTYTQYAERGSTTW